MSHLLYDDLPEDTIASRAYRTPQKVETSQTPEQATTPLPDHLGCRDLHQPRETDYLGRG